MLKSFLLTLVILFCWGGEIYMYASPVVIRIADEEVTLQELIKKYHTFLKKESCTITLNEFAEKYALHKLKLLKAKQMGIDTTSTFRERKRSFLQNMCKEYFQDSLGIDLRIQSSMGVADYKLSEKRLISQLFRFVPQQATARTIQAAQNEMDSLYQDIRLHPERDFSEWVEACSDDKRCRWVAPLQCMKEVQEVAFSLSEGEISSPFWAPDGLYIIKLIQLSDERKILSEIDLMSLFSEEKYETLLNEWIHKLQSRTSFQPNRSGITELLKTGSTRQTLFVLCGFSFTGEHFQDFSYSCPLRIDYQWKAFLFKTLIDKEYERWMSESSTLHLAYQDFLDRNLIKEVEHRLIDVPASTDRAGWRTYFQFHRSDYYWKSPKFKGFVYHCVDKKLARRVKKLLKKSSEEEWQTRLDLELKANEKENILIKQGLFEMGDNAYVDCEVFGGAVPPVIESHPITVVWGKKLKGPDDYRDVLQAVKKDYRYFLLNAWHKRLLASDEVEINQEVLKTVNNN